ncbi:MAG: ABC transporter substrate-binding protein [Fimbriimonadaceae bacterium]|jgi:putative spermidine/putrescine transport system substrate-binding protein|nr:ABC transporter substrate-binding protein [Alphaproteobacteria bacterium]
MSIKVNRRTALTIALAAPAILRSGRAFAANELRVMAWQGYADDDWVKEFEAQSGAKVNVVFIGTDDEIWAKIKGSEGKDFDVFAVNTAQLQRYIDGGLTTAIDLDKVPNQKGVLTRFGDLSKVKGVMRDGKAYAIPFCFDSIGLIYDKDKVKPAPDSFEILWDPKYKSKVLAYDNGEHNFSFTALTLGIEDPFHLSADQMAKIKEKLVALKQNVLSFYSAPDEALQLYKSNDVALIWANYGQQQVKAMVDAGANIAYVNPKEGALAWLDTWALTSGVQDKGLAEAWVNFLLQKKIAEQLSQRTGFGNTVVETGSAGSSDKLIWLDFVEDPTKRSDLWNEIKAQP